MKQYANRTIAAVADGCAWGVEVRIAASKAVNTFMDYIEKYQRDFQTLRDVGYQLMRAFQAAHNVIIEGRNEENLFQAGSTTMIGIENIIKYLILRRYIIGIGIR